jgi:hypothetical protein
MRTPLPTPGFSRLREGAQDSQYVDESKLSVPNLDEYMLPKF